MFGDVLGVQIANAVAGGLRHARDAAGAFASNAAEFVTEESRDVVPRDELNAFHDDVDTLRDDVERIAARVTRLRARCRRRAHEAAVPRAGASAGCCCGIASTTCSTTPRSSAG